MHSPHTLPLRSALAALKPQPKLLTPCNPPPSSSTTSLNPLQRRSFTAPPPLSTTRTTRPTSTPPNTLHPIRLATTTTTTTAAPAPPLPQPTPSTPDPTSSPLTWNAYLTLRKTRRRYNLAASVLSSLLTTAGGFAFLTTGTMESVSVFGFDPMLVLAVATVGSGAVGWLLGPFVGERVFGLVYWRVGGWVGEKEKDFYQRIKKHRVDPSGGSSANPVPDYYGEKIGSVKEYRNWMKDQRAFNKRRQNFL